MRGLQTAGDPVKSKRAHRLPPPPAQRWVEAVHGDRYHVVSIRDQPNGLPVGMRPAFLSALTIVVSDVDA
jgi:hypothetical protein